MTPMLERARRYHGLGFSIVPLQFRSKKPDGDVLPLDADGNPVWAPFKTHRPTDAELVSWFGNGTKRNLAVVTRGLYAVVDGDSPEALAWMNANLPYTNMKTRTSRGEHWFYRRPPDVTLPAEIHVSNNLEIELKRDGQYVVGPGSVHETGAIYEEIEPWPSDLSQVPVLPDITFGGVKRTTRAEPLAATISDGGRNNTLFREGCRLRQLGHEESEILATLTAVNAGRCHPPLDRREVESIARSCAKYEVPADTFPTTETGDAEVFAALNADTVRYDYLRGRWLLFDGHIWVPQTDGQIARLALDTVRARQRAAVGDKDRMRWAIGGESRTRQINLLALAQSIKPLADKGESWDLDPWLLGAPNGIIDLQTGALRPGRPEDRITMRVRAAFNPDATCPLYDKTVDEIFEANTELIAYFDRYVGYSLTGDCREESLAFCWGGGANGKGTLMNTIGWLLGDYADDLPFSAFELQSRAGIPNDIAKIANKRFVTASETGEKQRLNEARVKALTGRDPITARFLHREFFTFQPVAKFWLAMNHKPDVRDDSEGFWRRLHLIPFTASFIGREDKTLKDRLRAEADGILARAVRGCLAWQREGLNPPDVVREATKTYRADSMPLARFLDQCCVVQDGMHATFGELFKAYVKSAGHEPGRMGRHEFNDALHQRFEHEVKNQRVVFLGVGLLDLFRESEL